MKTKEVLFWTGIFIVVVTHIYMLFAGLSEDQMASHAGLNLIAGGLLISSNYMKK